MKKKSELEELDKGSSRETRTPKKQVEQSPIAPSKEKSKGKAKKEKGMKHNGKELSYEIPSWIKALAKKTKAKHFWSSYRTNK